MLSEVERSLNMPQNALDQCKMRFTRGMHVKANLLHDIGDVGASKS